AGVRAADVPATVVEIDHLFERREAAGVEIRAGELYVSKRRRLERSVDCVAHVRVGDDRATFDRLELAGVEAVAVGVRRRRAFHHVLVLTRSEEHTSELQSPYDLVCRLLLEKKKI